MSVPDPATGMQRILTFDEVLQQMWKEEQDSTKPMNPTLVRTATNFWVSPYNQRLYNSVYEDLQHTQVIEAATQARQAAAKAFQAQTGVPPDMMPRPPPDPPDGGGGGGGSQDSPRTHTPAPRGRGDGGRSSTPAPFPGSGSGQERRPGRSRTPKRSGWQNAGDFMDDDDDSAPPPPPAAGAAAIAVPTAPPMVTPQQNQTINELKLIAELQRVSQSRDQIEREHQTNKQLAAFLFQQRASDPIRQAQHAVRETTPAPQVVTVPQPISQEQVTRAINQAMQGERRSLQELMTHHSATMEDVVSKAVKRVEDSKDAGSKKKKQVTFDTPTSHSWDPMPTAPAAAPVAPAAPVSRSYKKGVKHAWEEPLDPTLDLEDIYYLERTKENPNRKKSRDERVRKRKSTLRDRPLTYGVDQYSGPRKRPPPEDDDAEAIIEKRKPLMPAVRSEQARQLGAMLGKELRRRQIEKQLRSSKVEAQRAITGSVGRNPVRLDQWDNKRSVADMINEALDDIALPPKRRMLRA